MQELGTKYEYAFTVKGSGSGSGTGTGGGTNPCSVEAVKVEDKDLKDLDLATETVITIQFGRGMTENQTANKVLISVVNTETNEKAGITVGEVYNKNYVEVTITEIEPGEYKLVLGKDIKSNNGQTLGDWNNGEDYTVPFTYKIAEANCTCMCHAKNGIKAILWKIVLFLTNCSESIPFANAERFTTEQTNNHLTVMYITRPACAGRVEDGLF